MVIVGLTGSIGMGKTTVAQMFRSRGVPVFDADAEVHALYESDVVPYLKTTFPEAIVDGRVDRTRLAGVLAADPSSFRALEAVVHPFVAQRTSAFLRAEAARGTPVAVLEIPLMFETGAEAKVDAVVVVSAPAEVQRGRVLARPGMTADKLQHLLKRQMPDVEKRARADFIVETDMSITDTEQKVDAILEALQTLEGCAFDRHWA